MCHKRLFAGFVLLVVSPSATAQSEFPKVPLRVVVLTESNGVNAAADHKRIEQQVMLLCNDAARHGLDFVFLGTTFEADSQRRHANPASIISGDKAARAAFPARPDAIVIYVTGLEPPATTADRTRFLVIPPKPDSGDPGAKRGSEDKAEKENDASVPPLLSGGQGGESAIHPVIVIERTEFGGEGCGPGRDRPCRALSLALAEALAVHASDEAIRSAATEMKARAAEALAQE